MYILRTYMYILRIYIYIYYVHITYIHVHVRTTLLCRHKNKKCHYLYLTAREIRPLCPTQHFAESFRDSIILATPNFQLEGGKYTPDTVCECDVVANDPNDKLDVYVLYMDLGSQSNPANCYRDYVDVNGGLCASVPLPVSGCMVVIPQP